jgi:hypothetical protein
MTRYEALAEYLRRVAGIIEDTLGDDDSVQWPEQIRGAAESVEALAVDHRGAVDLIRELHGILAPPEVDDPSAVPIAVDKIEAWLDAHGGQ